MKMFAIDLNSRKIIHKGVAMLCVASLLTACSQSPVITSESNNTYVTIRPTAETVDTEVEHIETAIPLSAQEETVDMASVIAESGITILNRSGQLGEYSFFDCNETQLFGDYSIACASYEEDEYLMLSGNGIVLLAHEDGSNAKLFYNGKRLDLPFPCNFNVEYEFLGLYEGDFAGDGSRQLALVIPVETGSGIDIEHLQLINLDTMTLMPLYSNEDGYEEDIYSLFEAHFAETGMAREYYLFNYVQYCIHDSLILAEYGACDEDNNYLCFLEASLTCENGRFQLNPAMTFTDENY